MSTKLMKEEKAEIVRHIDTCLIETSVRPLAMTLESYDTDSVVFSMAA